MTGPQPTSNRMRVLQFLAENGPQETHDLPDELREFTGMDKLQISQTLSNLQAKGLIARKVVLTPEGLEWFKGHNPTWERLQS